MNYRKTLLVLVSIFLLVSSLSLVVAGSADSGSTLWEWINNLFSFDGDGRSPLTGAVVFAGGNGTVVDPFQISNCAQLQRMNEINDIDCNVAPFNTGAGFDPVGKTGANLFDFNGQGFSITGLFINRPTTDNVGLFGFIDGSPINNVNLIDVNIIGRDKVGGLVGFKRFGLIENVSVSGAVKGRNSVGIMAGAGFFPQLLNDDATGTVSGFTKVGGLIGEIQRNNFINNSFAIANVSGTNEIGGLAGSFQGVGLMENSYSEGSVSGFNSVGGLVGRFFTGAVINNSNSGATVTGSSTSSSVGGLVGSSSGAIDNSFATGSVTGRQRVGGLVGSTARGSSLGNSFATGNVVVTGASPRYIGGLVGFNNERSITNSFATGNVTANSAIDVGGLVGISTRSARILNTFATGNVIGFQRVGGLVGSQSGEAPSILNSYATGDVSGRIDVGGLLGENGRGFGLANTGIVRDSYATGSVSGVNVFGIDRGGGLVGRNSPTGAIIENSYYNNHSGNPDVCVGSSPSQVQCGVVQNNEAFFFNKCNAPMNKGDFFTTPVWGVQAGDHSCLLGIGEGCSQAINDCTPACGNGVIEGTEQCDDGATVNEDGCSSTCTFETGFSCTPGVPSSCEVDLCARIIPVDTDGDGFREISNCCQLAAVRNHIAESYELISNVDCNVAPFNTGEGFEPIRDGFMGIFNGSGFNITGLYINRPSESDVGLFGRHGTHPVTLIGGLIRDVGLIDVNITGLDRTGGLIGRGSNRGTIIDSFVTGNVKGHRGVGGVASSMRVIVGSSFEGNVRGSRDVGGLLGSGDIIRNSFAKGTVFGSVFQVGGLVGRGNRISDSYAEVDVSSGAGLTGGLVGRLDSGFIINSNASGSVTSGSSLVGGLVGDARGSVINSSATGNVSGGAFVGGLVGFGRNAAADIFNSFATGSVSGTNVEVGGLIGRNTAGDIGDSFATGDVSGRDEVGGFAGRSTGTIDRSNSTGNVAGRSIVGGFVGRNGISSNNGIINNSFSTGNVIGTGSVGGFGGQQENVGSVMGNVSWLNTTDNPPVCVGLIGAGFVDCAPLVLEVCGNGIVEIGEQCDDGDTVNPASCGLGVCEVTVVDACVNSGPVNECTTVACVPGSPTEINETSCSDGLDNDCDGLADDNDSDCDLDGDGFVNLVDNCPLGFNPDQLDVDSQDGGDVCDVCPADASDTCDFSKAAGEYIKNSAGGDVVTADGSANISLPAGVAESSISITPSPAGNASVLLGAPAAGKGVIVTNTQFRFEPSGINFTQPVTITLTYDDSLLKGKQEDKIAIYLFNTVTGRYDELVTSSCDTVLNVCTATINGFSLFAIIVLADNDGDGVLDDKDFCPETNEGASIIESGDFIGCTAGQLKGDAVDEFRELSSDLLQSGTEVGPGEVLDVLFLLVNAREGIVQDNFLFRTKPPESVVGDKKASADVDFELSRSFVKAASGSFSDETIITSTDQNDIINAIIGFGLPGLTDSTLVAELLEVREVKVLEGSEAFEFQQIAFEKLDEFKGKKINGVEINGIPDILANTTFLQSKLVADSRFLASILLDNLDCSSIAVGSAARNECDLGLSFLSQGEDTSLKGPERIDFYSKAWLQGVKVLDELSIFTFGDVARRF